MVRWIVVSGECRLCVYIHVSVCVVRVKGSLEPSGRREEEGGGKRGGRYRWFKGLVGVDEREEVDSEVDSASFCVSKSIIRTPKVPGFVIYVILSKSVVNQIILTPSSTVFFKRLSLLTSSPFTEREKFV